MLKVDEISFSYKNDQTLSSISFEAYAGDHIAIVGESGSGKTTLLKLIYGEMDLDNGTISWKDQKILGPKHNLVIGQDYVKYVAQEFDLMPFITVAENVGKHLSNFYLDNKSKRISELLKIVELEDLASVKVQFLSGGQKQRVALAQALAKEPEIILLDEPFSHIDNFKKQSLRRNLFRYLKEQQITCVIATHDKEDVLPFSDNVIVLHKGGIEASGKPLELYKNPKTPRIASFFGEYNKIDTFGIVYAHQLKVSPEGNMNVIVVRSYFKGAYYLVEATFNTKTVFFQHGTPLKEGSQVVLKVD